jgi:hypothetical protein
MSQPRYPGSDRLACEWRNNVEKSKTIIVRNSSIMIKGQVKVVAG